MKTFHNSSGEMQACISKLRRVSVFSDLPDEQLEWFIENSDELFLEAGEFLFRKGDKADWLSIYLTGEIHAREDSTRIDDDIYIFRAGDPATEISGKLPFSRMTEVGLDGQVVLPVHALLFPASLFPELFQRMPKLTERLVWIMSDRVRESTKVDERRDKLMSLGKLSAGLAHELNNPAAAARRTANEMVLMLEELRVADLNLCRHQLSTAERGFLSDFEGAVLADPLKKDSPKNALAMSDCEDEINDWLTAHQIADGWRLAPILADTNIDLTKLDQIAEKIPSEALKDVLTRLTAHLAVTKLAAEIKISATRISELVGAIKEYSYMDQAAIQEIDLHKALDNTLLILKHNLKTKNIEVTLDYAENLPKITAHGSMLNQVWTNLIDNAVDAMAPGGKLKIKTKLEPGDILVEIRDNGSGIPDEIQSRIFEPFFTTKNVNEGTGLGLDTVLRIIRKHHGNLRFESKPGDTCFQVRLPLQK